MSELVDEIERAGHGAVLVTGKGGVGKTTVAGLIAAELARRGNLVHLSSTDPAGHAALTAATLPTLTTSAIDPEVATREYVEGRMRSGVRQGLDPEHLDLLAEDLRSPCSQEVAVFQAFHRLLGRARDEFVIIDTAPTGHTLLLLDTTGAYHRQSVEAAGQQVGRVITPLMRLQDRGYSKVVIVTLPETTPVAEATELQDDLRRAGIEPYGWVVNATLVESGTTDPVLAARARLEQAQLERVASSALRLWALPWDPTIATSSLPRRCQFDDRFDHPVARLTRPTGSSPARRCVEQRVRVGPRDSPADSSAARSQRSIAVSGVGRSTLAEQASAPAS